MTAPDAPRHVPTLRGPRATGPYRRRARPVIDDAIVQALLPANREPEPEDRELAHANARLWHTARLSPAMVRSWLQAGAHPEEASLVSALLQEGITHDRAGDLVTHPDTGERVTVLDLARREHRALQPQYLQQALDAAEVQRVGRPFRWWAGAGA